MPDSDAQIDQLLAQVQSGDRDALEALLSRHRDRLRRMIQLRMDSRLSARIDASDVIQDTLVEVTQRLGSYLRNRPVPFYVWLRKIAWQRLIDLHEHHVTTSKRSVTVEIPFAMKLSDQSVACFAAQLAADTVTPSEKLMQRERYDRIRNALAELSEHDREVLILRYLEQLSIKETAATLELSENAVSVRQLRALVRLRSMLAQRD